MMGVPMHPWTMGETLDEISRRLDEGKFIQHVVVNVAKLVRLQNDSVLRDSVVACDIINVDGMGIVWGAGLLGVDIPERVAGIDLFSNLLHLASERGDSVFLLGALPEVIEKTVKNIQEDYPKLQIAGWHHGYFWDNEKEVVDIIRYSGAKLLFVGIRSPKKEQFICSQLKNTGASFAMGVGGSFDIFAGLTKRAPVWMQNFGLEWFYRIMQEPRRMFMRYFVTNSKFLKMVIKKKWE